MVTQHHYVYVDPKCPRCRSPRLVVSGFTGIVYCHTCLEPLVGRVLRGPFRFLDVEEEMQVKRVSGRNILTS